jgi:hypothetical protein
MSKGRREGRPEPSTSQDRGDPRDTPAQAKPATHRPAALAEPIVVSKFFANRKHYTIVVQLREFEGRSLLDVRKHYTAADGGEP